MQRGKRAWSDLRRGTGGTERGRGPCRGARERPDCFSLLAASLTRSPLPSCLPSPLETRTPPRAEVSVTPSAGARTVARAWTKVRFQGPVPGSPGLAAPGRVAGLRGAAPGQMGAGAGARARHLVSGRSGPPDRGGGASFCPVVHRFIPVPVPPAANS